MADELDTFIQKFRNLWNSGLDARLNMESHAGLHLRLGPGPGPPHQVQTVLPKTSRNRDNPSRQRRRARRAAAREEKAAKATIENPTKAEEAVQEIFAEENSENTIEDSKTEEIDAKGTSEEDDCVGEVNGTIPQLDGGLEIVNEPTYCRICKDCHEEIETAEDLSYHVMNNHETNDVVLNYGMDWIESRRYCIRRNSPFYSWFSTPLIS